MELELAGQVVVVTGASKGIGLAIASAFVAQGAQVVAGARTSSPELEALGSGVTVVLGDLTDPEGPARLIAAAGPRIDVLVNNVGKAAVRRDGFVGIDDTMWQSMIDLNLMAAVRASRSALPLMVAAGRGVIVNIGSTAARQPEPMVIDYSAAKAALGNLAKSLSKEFGPSGIRVNTVDPGPVMADPPASPHAPTGRFTRPQEVADLVLFLASARSANVTGANFVIDGGLISTL